VTFLACCDTFLPTFSGLRALYCEIKDVIKFV